MTIDSLVRYFGHVPDSSDRLREFDDASVDRAPLERLSFSVTHISNTARRRFGSEGQTPMGIMNLMWTKQVSSLLTETFQLALSGFQTERNLQMWEGFL